MHNRAKMNSNRFVLHFTGGGKGTRRSRAGLRSGEENQRKLEILSFLPFSSFTKGLKCIVDNSPCGGGSEDSKGPANSEHQEASERTEEKKEKPSEWSARELKVDLNLFSNLVVH